MKRSGAGWMFVLPALLHLVVFAVGPILYAMYISLFQWNLLKGESDFVGFRNFARIAQDEAFLNALQNSAIYTAASVPIGTAIALCVALLVAPRIRGVAVFRTIYYLPAVCSQVATAMIWIYVFLPKKGMINAVLGWFGQPNDIDFLNTSGWAMAALVFMSIWTALGPRMVLFVSGILNIPASLYEAAELDGASRGQQFWKVTLPLLAPTMLFVVVTSTIGAMQVFTPVYMMTKGGPEGSTDVVGYHIYSAAWERFQVGEASAMSVVLFAVIAVLASLQFRAMNQRLEAAS